MKVALSFITIGEGKKCLVYKIVSTEEYNATHFAINVNYVNGIILSLLKMEISIYHVMDALGSSRM